MAALRREDVTGDGITEQIVAEVQLRGWKVLHGRGCHKTQELLLYDHMGNITSPTEGGENTTLYACDLSGNMVTITDPTGEKELYSYDKEGHVAEKTDRNGITTQYAFNMYGAPLYRRVKDGTKAESYQYTSEGLMKAVISAGMHYNYEYDPMGRIIRKSASGRTLLAYGYDLNDNFTTRRYMTRNGLCMMLINILKNLIAGVISTVL